MHQYTLFLVFHTKKSRHILHMKVKDDIRYIP